MSHGFMSAAHSLLGVTPPAELQDTEAQREHVFSIVNPTYFFGGFTLSRSSLDLSYSSPRSPNGSSFTSDSLCSCWPYKNKITERNLPCVPPFG